MPGRGQIPSEKNLAMLDGCAPGHTIRRKKQQHWVTYNERTYWRLPTGEHGSTNPDIEVGHVRKMIRHLWIDDDCARRLLPQL